MSKTPIARITKASLQRLGYVAGVRQMNAGTYEELRSILYHTLKNVVNIAVTYSVYYKKRTVTEPMVSTALSGTVSLPGSWSAKLSDKGCPRRKTTEGKRKAKKGAKAMREIQSCQKQSECLYLPRTVFDSLVREISDNYGSKRRYTKNAMLLLQYAVERYLIEILQGSQIQALHANRLGVSPKDIAMVRRIQNRAV